jgi:hypothetical protein
MMKFSEPFFNRLLPKPLWKFLSAAKIIPFHKLSQAERDLLDILSPKLRLVTIGALLARFSCGCVLRMRKIRIAGRMLLSNHFSYVILNGAQQVTLGCTIALQCNHD